MFAFWKRKREQRKELDQGFHHARLWRDNEMLQCCFNALRGSFTVAQTYHQEAVEATVAIALTEDNWTEATDIPEVFLPEKCFIYWNEPTLPMLLCESAEVLSHLQEVTALSTETFLIAETMDRIVLLKDESVLLYSIA